MHPVPKQVKRRAENVKRGRDADPVEQVFCRMHAQACKRLNIDVAVMHAVYESVERPDVEQAMRK